jgi:hypothetical protein
MHHTGNQQSLRPLLNIEGYLPIKGVRAGMILELDIHMEYALSDEGIDAILLPLHALENERAPIRLGE